MGQEELVSGFLWLGNEGIDKFIIIGGKEDIDYNKEFEEDIRSLPTEKCIINLTGSLGIAETIEVLSELYIGSDAAPAHMAGLAGCKCLVVFCNYDNMVCGNQSRQRMICHRPKMSCGARAGDDYGIAAIDPNQVLKVLGNCSIRARGHTR